MELKKGEHYVMGLDYGSDSCRTVLIDAADGSEVGMVVMAYPRWAKGLYCRPGINRFRQHPQDYIDVLEGTVGALSRAGTEVTAKIRGIAIDTTGSTPCAADRRGMPLALEPGFSENPSAMFVLWKDHTAVGEARRINEAARTWGGTDFTKFSGGAYSAEWFWAKALRVFDEDPHVAEAAATVIEHCDWMTALLTGAPDAASIKRSRCAMGHKAMWHAEFGGCPPADFWARLDKRLVKIRESLGNETYTSDKAAGLLCAHWAERLGLPEGIPVAVGAYDAHMGAVGGGVKPGRLVRVMGTSTCDVIVAPKAPGEEPLVRGICGQVDGSVIPGLTGYEAGQSAFGDVYAWFKKLLLWPIEALLPHIPAVDQSAKEKAAQTLAKLILPALEKEAALVEPSVSGVVALDWLNGRRTPDADQTLSGALSGLTLDSDAPKIYRALIESTAFGARAIVERFREQGVPIESIAGVGGVARRSPLAMQVLADVLNMPIEIPANDQTVALGAAIFAAVAAGLYPDVPAAQKAVGSPVETVYTPNPALVRAYDKIYGCYKALGAFVESRNLPQGA
ncbi:MAG: ribulokinase [Spirochaetaceae bacterium]|jgi:L-ribulokinase|nr:ribulokinase [Spirochaetaceae bacterium]